MSGKPPEVMLPVAMKLVGPLHGEYKLLEFGYAYNWKYFQGGENYEIFINRIKSINLHSDN